ncbi:MAG TPA: HNH endonuclease [Chloroflexia bacterium]|jgi:5-methylcytosine-specific restriction endonuclease McrA
MMYNAPVLVLNQNYEPLNVCNVKRALVLVLGGKAEVLELNHQVIHTPTLSIHCPSVIRLAYLIRRPRVRARLSRKEIFIRDSYTCQYCGVKTRDLTLDHVIPRSKSGPHTWENLVSACRGCNHRKGGKSLAEARMHLARAPREPRANIYHMVYRYMETGPLDEWLIYLPGMQPAVSSSSPS